MKKITYDEFCKNMWQYNTENPSREDYPDLFGVIVYTKDNWQKEYSEESRSLSYAFPYTIFTPLPERSRSS